MSANSSRFRLGLRRISNKVKEKVCSIFTGRKLAQTTKADEVTTTGIYKPTHLGDGISQEQRYTSTATPEIETGYKETPLDSSSIPQGHGRPLAVTPNDKPTTDNDKLVIADTNSSRGNSYQTGLPLQDKHAIDNNDKPIVPAAIVSQEISTSAVTSGIAIRQEQSSSTATQKLPTFDSHISDDHSGKIAPSTCWEKALSELTDNQRQVLYNFGIENIQTFEGEIKILQNLKDNCTNNLIPGKSDKNPIMTRARIHNILKNMNKFAIIVDTAIQQNPDIIALVWASVRFCLQVALNDMHTFEGISSALEDIVGIMGSCRIYERIHGSSKLESSKAVIKQIPRLYAHCLGFIAEALDYFHTKALKRFAEGATNPFEIRFKPLIEDISNGKREMDRRAAIAGHELQDTISRTQREEFSKLNDQLGLFQMDMLGIKSGVNELLAHVDGTKRREFFRWLSGVDFSAHHEKARDLRFNNTGEWLIAKSPFENWIEAECSSVLWLYGKAGSGKTVLSSLVIDTLTETYKSVPTIYFYCNYGEQERKETSSIVKSLLKQLSTRSQMLDPQMVSAFDNSMPLDVHSVETSFAAALSRFGKTFIVVDALDECSEEERRSVVMFLTRQLRLEGCQVKIFLTSRLENELRRLLKDYLSYQIDADDTSKDITPFVAATIANHIKTGMLLGGNVPSALREELVKTISVQADGMFLWAKLQLDYICKQGNEKEVRAQLQKLPRGLHNTYDRIWTKIIGELSDDTERKWALRTLGWVLKAKEPLSPNGILEATAILPLDTSFDATLMVSSLDYLIQVCGGFVALDVRTNRLCFVHYSVQEFLSQQPEFSSTEDLVTEVCFTVLGWERANRSVCENLYTYAAQHWEKHSGYWGEINYRRGDLIRRFLLDNQCLMEWNSYRKWGYGEDRLVTPNRVASYFNCPVILQYLQEQQSHNEDFVLEQSESLLVGALQGYAEIVDLLLKAGADANIRGGEYGFALQAAAFKGSEKVVEILLNAGADVNAQGGEFGSALQAAASKGFQRVVELLLKAGADVNARSGRYGSPLQIVALRAFEKVAELLLDAGANVNSHGVHDSSALQAAAYKASEKVVELLLNAGADVDNRSGFLGSALQEAAWTGSEKVAKLVIDAGADVNTQIGRYGTSLQIAAGRAALKVVELMINGGADVNACSGRYGYALQAAASKGSVEVTELLLNSGADVNAQSGRHGSALQAASSTGSENVVKLLLHSGADVNCQAGEYGSALQVAASKGFETVVELLLKAGADVNARGGGFGSALKAAAFGGFERVVKILIDAGADVNAEAGDYAYVLQAAAAASSENVVELLLSFGTRANVQGGDYGYALQAASSVGSEKVVALLLNAGAEVNAQGGDYGYALQAAASAGSEKVVEMLLNSGADINAQSGRHGSALQAAASASSKKIMNLLLNSGADVNAQGGEYGSALHTAAWRGSEKAVELLLDAGADVNAQVGEYGSALQIAAFRGFEDVVKLLLDAGADVNTQDGEFGSALHAAASVGSMKVVQLLLNAGADVNAQSGDFRYAVRAASFGGFEKVVEQLLNAGADANTQDRQFVSISQAEEWFGWGDQTISDQASFKTGVGELDEI